MSSMPLEPTALTGPRRLCGMPGDSVPQPGSEHLDPAVSPGTDRRSGGSRATTEPVPLAKVIPLPERQERKHGAFQAEDREAGMATAEYAIATLAAVAFAALLVAVLSSGDVRELLMSLIRAALSFG
ncbi:DUF4244 domain-containing protein [Arthrobacter sp. NPDC055585]